MKTAKSPKSKAKPIKKTNNNPRKIRLQAALEDRELNL